MSAARIRKTRSYFEAMRREFQAAKRISQTPEDLSLQAESVSGWCVGEHLEHLFLTDSTILRQIVELDPKIMQRGKPKPNFWGWVVLLLGFRQRGVAKSPKQVIPHNPNAENLRELCTTIEGLFAELEPKLDHTDLTRWIFPHPRLGRYSAQQWFRFAEVHHQHHHRIIAEIRHGCVQA